MNDPFSVSVVRSGSDALVYVAARSCGIYLVRRIVAGVQWDGGGASYTWYRPGGYNDFEVGGEQVEPNIVILKARKWIGNQPGKVSAVAHYVRVDRTARAEAQV